MSNPAEGRDVVKRTHRFSPFSRPAVPAAIASWLAFLAAPPAAAYAQETPAWAEAPRRWRFESDLSFFSFSDASDSMTGVVPVFGLTYAISPVVHLGADWGLVYSDASDNGRSDSELRISNPLVRLTFEGGSPALRYKLGGGITLPVAQLPDEMRVQAATAYVAALRSHSLRRSYLWLPERLAMVIPVDLETEMRGGFLLGVDAALAAMFKLGDNDGDTDTIVAIDTGLRAGIRINPVTAGVRFGAVWIPTQERGDNAQTMFEPFARLDLGTIELRASFTINLDEPLGPSFESGKVWSLHLGAQFDF